MTSVQNRLNIDHSGSQDFYKHYEDHLCNSLTNPDQLIPTIYYYDDRGSTIYERLCRSQNYYLTRAEFSLLRKFASSLSMLPKFDQIVEFGSGSSSKTRLILDHALSVSSSLSYCPIDINGEVLASAATSLLEEIQSLEIHGTVGSYEYGVERASSIPGKKLYLFLGSTFSQFSDDDTITFLNLMKKK